MLALGAYGNGAHAGWLPIGVSQASRKKAEHKRAPIQGSLGMHLQLCKGRGIAHEAVTCTEHEAIEVSPQR